MTKERDDNSRADLYVEMWRERPQEILDELDATHSFLSNYSKEFGDQGDPRMGFIVGLMADLATIVYLIASDVIDGQGNDPPDTQSGA